MWLTCVLLLLLPAPACAPKIESSDVTGSWHLAAEEARRWGYPSADLVLQPDGSFRAEDVPGRLLFPDITGAYTGHGKWTFDYYQGKPRIELTFENRLNLTYRKGTFESVEGYRTHLWVGREGGEPYLFLWSREEGSTPIAFRRK